MRYSKKVTIAPLVALAVGGSLVAYVGVGHQKFHPTKPATETGSIAKPTTAPSQQIFAGITGMKVKYPAHWSATPGVNNPRTNDQLSVIFKAPDTITQTTNEGDEKVVKGAKIQLYKNNFSKSKSIEDYKNSDSFIWKYAQNKSESVINGTPVLQFDATYEGSQRHYAIFYKNSHEYMMIMDEEVYLNTERKTVFDNMLKNLEFNKSP